MSIAEDPGRAREADFPYDASRREQMKFMLNFAVLAPSICDSQPWIFRVAGDAVELYADRSRRLRELDPRGRQVVISCGAALLNLRVAIEYFGAEATIKTFPQMDLPDLLASVRMGAAKTPSEEVRRLFRSLYRCPPRRRETQEGQLPASAFRAVGEAVTAEGALFDLLNREDAGHRKLLALIDGAGDFPAAANGREVDRRSTAAPQALSPATLTVPSGDGLPPTPAFVVASASPDSTEPRQDEIKPGRAPMIAVISTRADNPFEWLTAGQALARMYLTARELDVQVSFLSQAVDFGGFGEQFRRTAGADRVPQVVLQMSAGNGGLASRRPLHDMLSVF